MAFDEQSMLTLLEEFNRLPPSPPEPTNLFSVAGFPHYENVCSNILAFYLDPENEHGMGDLLLAALLDCAKHQAADNGFASAVIEREASTIKGGRLDLVIETDDLVIGVENKIYHQAINDFADYSESLDKRAKSAKETPREVVKLILWLKEDPKLTEPHGFVAITYAEFWAAVRSRLGAALSISSQKWALYLIDFMDSVDKLMTSTSELSERDLFLINNHEHVEALVEAHKQLAKFLRGRVDAVAQQVNKPDGCTKQWVHRGNCLVHDYMIAEHKFAFDLVCSGNGRWLLAIFQRGKGGAAVHSTLVGQTLAKLYEPGNMPKHKDHRFTLFDIPFNETTTDDICEQLGKCLNDIITTARELAQ